MSTTRSDIRDGISEGTWNVAIANLTSLAEVKCFPVTETGRPSYRQAIEDLMAANTNWSFRDAYVHLTEKISTHTQNVVTYPVIRKANYVISHEKMRKLLGLSTDTVIRNIEYDPDYDSYKVTLLTTTIPFDGKDSAGRGVYTVEGAPLMKQNMVTN